MTAQPAGERNERISIEHQPTTSTDKFGKVSGEWVELCERWASVVEGAVADRTAQKQKQSIASHTLVMQYTPTVTEGMRVIWGERTLNVVSVRGDRWSDTTTIEALEGKA